MVLVCEGGEGVFDTLVKFDLSRDQTEGIGYMV